MTISKKAFSALELAIVLTIAGLLMTSVIIGTKASYTAKLNAARSLTVNSPVGRIKGLTLWLDAAGWFEGSAADSFVASDINSSTASIGTWYDTKTNSSYKLNVTQGTASKKPTYIKDATNGLPSVKFDGGDNLTTASITASNFVGTGSSTTNSGSATVFLVQKYNSPLHRESSVWWQGSSPTQRFNIHAIYGDNQTLFWDFGTCVCDATGRLSYVYTTASDFMDKWNIITVYKHSDASAKIRVNAVVMATSSAGTMTQYFSSTSAATLFIGSGSNTNYLNGYISEVIIYNRALSDNEIDDVEYYLSKKWGIII